MMIDTDNLWGIRDIAKAAKVTDAAVCNWRSRFDHFPAPVVTISDGTPIWDRRPVEGWLRLHGKI